MLTRHGVEIPHLMAQATADTTLIDLAAAQQALGATGFGLDQADRMSLPVGGLVEERTERVAGMAHCCTGIDDVSAERALVISGLLNGHNVETRGLSHRFPPSFKTLSQIRSTKGFRGSRRRYYHGKTPDTRTLFYYEVYIKIEQNQNATRYGSNYLRFCQGCLP